MNVGTDKLGKIKSDYSVSTELVILVMIPSIWVRPRTPSSYKDVTSVGCFNPTALRKAKTLWSFGLSKCNRVKPDITHFKTRTLLSRAIYAKFS